MPSIYRRPFDYPQHAQAFNVWAMGGLVEGVAATGAFTAHQATVSATTATDKYSRSVRYAAQGVFRRRWPHAEHQARIVLIYADADAIDAERAQGAFTGHAATVRLGSTAGATVAAEAVSAGLTTYGAAIEGGRRDPLADAIGQLATYTASLTRTAGLGESRVGATSAKPSGTYQPGSIRAPRRRVASTTNQIVRAK